MPSSRFYSGVPLLYPGTCPGRVLVDSESPCEEGLWCAPLVPRDMPWESPEGLGVAVSKLSGAHFCTQGHALGEASPIRSQFQFNLDLNLSAVSIRSQSRCSLNSISI